MSHFTLVLGYFSPRVVFLSSSRVGDNFHASPRISLAPLSRRKIRDYSVRVGSDR